MGRRKDLEDRINQATGATGRPAFDRTISRAMRQRREQYLEHRDAPEAGSDTATLQQRIAAARAATDDD